MKIQIVDGKFRVPEEFELSETKRRLVVKIPYMCRIERLNKNGQVTITQYMRQKGKDKPYIQEGTISIDGFIYEIEEIKNAQ